MYIKARVFIFFAPLYISIGGTNVGLFLLYANKSAPNLLHNLINTSYLVNQTYWVHVNCTYSCFYIPFCMQILDRIILFIVDDSDGDPISNLVVKFSVFRPLLVLSLFVVFTFIQRLSCIYYSRIVVGASYTYDTMF